jgi:hypothetical protein
VWVRYRGTSACRRLTATDRHELGTRVTGCVVQGFGAPADNDKVHDRGWTVLRILVLASSIATLVAVLMLPWRWVVVGDPFGLGSHLYQMNTPVLFTVLLLLPLVSMISTRELAAKDWASVTLFVCGIGVTFCSLVVHLSDRALLGSAPHTEVGYALAFLCGLVTAVAGCVAIALRFRLAKERG